MGWKYLVILVFLGLGMGGRSQDTLDLYPEHRGALVCWTETLSLPRPLRMHFLRVDLTCSGLEVITLAGEDPDSTGPAESTLTLPSDLFSESGAMAAINANAFAGLPGTEKDIRGWYRNRPVDVQGMAVINGRMISPDQEERTAFWTDRFNRPHIGDPGPSDPVWQAVSDWSGPLLAGNTILADSAVTILHPRSALGFDGSGKWLLLVVIDGRHQGTSEGVSLYELASLFRAKGCTEAINLDGGGSSILLIQAPDGGMQTVNRPSGLMQRPIPVMLGICRKQG